MCQACHYTIHAAQHHFGWDNQIPPVAHVTPGSRVHLACQDASAGQLRATSGLDDLIAMDPTKANPVTGPLYIEGAEPGDILKVTLEDFTPSGFGWTANIPGFGLLADQFPNPALHIWSYDAKGLTPALFGPHAKVPLKPFAGTVGNAPAEPGCHSVIPPRRIGGNLDIRDLAKGSELFLPVEVAGALFSIGDTHAAQGDGEVCGTAIESPMNVTLRLDLIKQSPLAMPRFRTTGPVTNHLDTKGYEVTTGVGPDLMAGARDAVAGMIDLLCAEHGLAAIDAYLLASVCGDLRISEIVDAPNWVVSFYFPRCVFE
ncbi:acetamidase [Cohaesibacter sp. CAU 1516]|uniref:acetamidase/formamidase family protein n=1 Tax=Cohaesibacter sp. CAU 1516 TaxID=2576038 RepID=UPI0010FF0C4C|nr:acetamidase/formamidase family protein [Cohaesibacter sp. CAU 1516]TLP48691.1 acetamidase [Cohaesibacter sp. CAU 1516]